MPLRSEHLLLNPLADPPEQEHNTATPDNFMYILISNRIIQWMTLEENKTQDAETQNDNIVM